MKRCARRCEPGKVCNPKSGRCIIAPNSPSPGTPGTPRGRNSQAFVNAINVQSKRSGRTIRSNIVADPRLAPAEKKKEMSYIARAKNGVSSAISKVKDTILRNKLKSISLLLVAVSLYYAHTQGYLPTKSQTERDVLRLLRGGAKSNAEAMNIIKSTMVQNNKGHWVLGNMAKRHKLSENMCKYTPHLCKPGILPRSHMPQVKQKEFFSNILAGASLNRLGAKTTSVTLHADQLKPIQKQLDLGKAAGISKSFDEKWRFELPGGDGSGYANVVNGRKVVKIPLIPGFRQSVPEKSIPGGFYKSILHPPTPARYASVSENATRPILAAKVGSEYFVIDGHHRWAAAWAHDPRASLAVKLIELPPLGPKETVSGALMKVLGVALQSTATTYKGLVSN